MLPYYGDLTEDQTVDIYFNTFTSNDPSASSTITDFINTDVHIHKDGGLTPRNNAAGITVSANFDGITGTHLIKIDTSDNTVADFWVTGSDYMVRIEGTAVDGAVINAGVGTFSIENRFNEVDLTHIMGTILTEGAGGRLAAAFIKLLDVATPLLVASAVMRGTDSANTTTPPTVTEIQAEMEENGASILDAISVLLPGSTIAAATDIPAMVGTNNAALATKLTKYVQLLARSDAAIETDNVTELTAINANGGSGAGDFSSQSDSEEALQALLAAIPTTAMRGTDSANTTTPPTANQVRDAILDDATRFSGAKIDAAVSSRAVAGDTMTLSANAITAAVIATDAIDADSIKADAVTKIQNGLATASNVSSAHTTTDGKIDTVDGKVDTIVTAVGLLPEAPQKNVALDNLEFLMVDETDFATPETGLTVTGQVSKDGAAFGNISGSIAEVSNGIYSCDAAQADMNADILTFRFSAAGAMDTFITIKTTS